MYFWFLGWFFCLSLANVKMFREEENHFRYFEDILVKVNKSMNGQTWLLSQSF